MNKRGIELSIRTIIIIVLAILVLAGLIIMFTQQTSIFSDFLDGIFGKSNVDSMITSCNSFAGREAFYEFCCTEKTIKYELGGKLKKEKMTCLALSENPLSTNKINKLNCEGICAPPEINTGNEYEK